MYWCVSIISFWSFWWICTDKSVLIFMARSSFLGNLWAWSNLFIASSPSLVVDFVDWIGSCWEVLFLVFFFVFWRCLRHPLYTPCILCSAFLVLFNTLFIYLSKIIIIIHSYLWTFLLKLDVIGDTVLRALPLKIQEELMEKGYTILMPMPNIVLWLRPN